MQAEIVIKLIKTTLEATVIVSAPLLLASLIVGVLISILQVVTAIQDATLAFIPRMLAIFIVFMIVFPWMLNFLTSYTVQLFTHMNDYIWK